jgi:hypothetical protein
MRSRFAILFVLLAAVCPAGGESPPKIAVISLAEAQPTLKAYQDVLPEELRGTDTLEGGKWAAWVKQNDQEVRSRLERGQEDTLSNLLRLGVTYTKEYRIDDEYLAKYGESTLVNSFADKRADDLIRALASPKASEGFVEMRAFLEKKGYSLQTPAARARLKKYLLTNLARLREDFLKAHSAEAKQNRWQSFEGRGISLDTNLWPDYDVELHLRTMAQKGMLPRGCIHKVAIVGPGLDFVNKQEGYDYYPPQTIQPFAVLDTLFRLKLADPNTVELYTMDISSSVNLHIERARKNALAGKPYVLQLPWLAGGRWTNEFRDKFVGYWKMIGENIGAPVAAIPLPKGAEGIEARALQVRPEVVTRITPVDMNIVFERLDQRPDQRFDLIIGTDIFVYYGAFEQSLARANVAAMLKPGGLLLSTEKLADRIPSGLTQDLTTEVPMTGPPVMTDYLFGYRKQ